jgi:hypothetical protein
MTANGIDCAQTLARLGVVGTIDTLELARRAPWGDYTPTFQLPERPTKLSLGALYRALTGQQLVDAHAALADAVATAHVLRRLLPVALGIDTDAEAATTRVVCISDVVQRIRVLRIERRQRLQQIA